MLESLCTTELRGVLTTGCQEGRNCDTAEHFPEIVLREDKKQDKSADDALLYQDLYTTTRETLFSTDGSRNLRSP